MRSLLASASLALLLALATGPSVSAQEAPEFMKQVFPEQGLKAAWEEYLAVMNPKGALDAKTKELIGLAVASAALVRKWSTMLNGSSYDRQKFQQQVDAIFASH